MNRSITVCAKCFVPSCKNTTTNSRHKVFVVVNNTLKRKWCEEVKVAYKPQRRFFCCEDHLNLEEDVERNVDYTNTNIKYILKPTAKLHLSKSLPSYPVDKQRPCRENIIKQTSALYSLLVQPIENSGKHNSTDIEGQKKTEKIDFSNNRPAAKFASTHAIKIDSATQYDVKTRDQVTSTKDLVFKLKILPSLPSPTSSSPLETISNPSLNAIADTESNSRIIIKPSDNNARKEILHFVSSDPKSYIGLPKHYFWLIKHITTQSILKATELHIIITLLKIKLNYPVKTICDQFQISREIYLQFMNTGIQVLANYFRNLIYLPTLLQIKQTQPLAFKIRYSDVCLLLYVFEIEIQKPHNAMSQAQTWSQYKNCNTMKYLIGSTPDGFISFISNGYGGRISDKTLVDKSGLIDWLPDNAVIMADRGFKEIESLLIVKGIKLLRPSSVYSTQKPTKEELIETKVLASLRLHIKRVVRRIREFRFLKPPSVISHKHVGYLDHIVLIACGLINLQN